MSYEYSEDRLVETAMLIPRLPKAQKPQPKFIKSLKNLAKLSCKNKIF